MDFDDDELLRDAESQAYADSQRSVQPCLVAVMVAAVLVAVLRCGCCMHVSSMQATVQVLLTLVVWFFCGICVSGRPLIRTHLLQIQWLGARRAGRGRA